MIIHAFNNMLEEGWDSAAQFSYCIQQSLDGDPQFWWVKDMLRKFPHPPEWQHVKRDPHGRYRSFPGGKSKSKASIVNQQIKKLARTLLKSGFLDEAKQIIGLIAFAGFSDLLKDIRQVEDLLRKGIFSKLSMVLFLGKDGLSQRFDNELDTAHKTYIPIIRERLLEMIGLLQGVRQGKDDSFIEAVDEVLGSLQKVKEKHGL